MCTPLLRCMTDFYKKRQGIFDKFEQVARTLTKQGKSLNQASYLLDVDRETAMGGVLKKHIDKLVEQGVVKRETNGDNVIALTWSE